MGIIEIILGLLGTLLYPLFSVIFTLISGIQGVFYAFAGVGTITFDGQVIGSGNTGAENDTGIVYYLFSNTLVKNMLLSIMLLGLFLVIIFTVMAFIKNAYAAKQKNWKEIIGNAIKGLGNFIIVPVACILGVWVANIGLGAINEATINGGSSQMDRKLFVACAYNSNEFRTGGRGESDWEELKSFAVSVGYTSTEKIKAGLTNDQYADILDDIYANCTRTNIYWQGGISDWYEVWSINYLVLLVGGIFMLYVLCSLAFAMVRRVILLVILFIISPGVCAMYPLDEGKAVGSWKGEFIKLTLSAYGAVAGMNIFFSILPLIDKIQVYSVVGEISGLNDIIQIFILVVGLLCVKELISLISNFVGGEDALGKGSSLMKSSMDSIKKYGKKAANVSSRFVGYAAPVVKGLGTSAFNIGKGAAKTVGKVGAGIGKGLGTIGGAVGRRVGAGASWVGNKVSNSKAGVAVRQAIFDANERRKESKARKAKKKEYKHMFDELDPEKLERDWAKAERRHEREKKFADFKRDYIDYYGGKVTGAAKKFGGAISTGASWVGNKTAAIAKGVAGSRFGQGVKNFGSEVGSGFKQMGGGIADGAKFAGAAIGSGAAKIPDAVKRTIGAVYDETGAKGWIDENIVKPYKGVGDRQAARDKAAKAGRAGTDKAASNLKNVGVDSMSSEVIKQLGDAIGTAVWRQKDLSKFKGEGSKRTFEEDKDILGLRDGATPDDLRDIDAVLSRLESFQNRLSNDQLDEATKRAILADAIRYARETDSNGNTNLQDALDAALGKFLELDRNKNVEIKSVTLDDTVAGKMIEASKDAAKTMADFFKKYMSQIAAAVEAEQRSKK